MKIYRKKDTKEYLLLLTEGKIYHKIVIVNNILTTQDYTSLSVFRKVDGTLIALCDYDIEYVTDLEEDE